MKAIGRLCVWAIGVASLTGCATIQRATNTAAEKYGGPAARAGLDDFRYAEGASVGMVDTRGANVRQQFVDDSGVELTNGVNRRMVIDRSLVPAKAAVPVNITPAVSTSAKAEAEAKLGALISGD